MIRIIRFDYFSMQTGKSDWCDHYNDLQDQLQASEVMISELASEYPFWLRQLHDLQSISRLAPTLRKLARVSG